MRRIVLAALLCSSALIFGIDHAGAAGARPRILTRAEWGADESLLYADTKEPKPAETFVPADEDTVVPERVKNCEEAQRKYPTEFKAARTVTTDASGRKLRWPQSYSSSIKLIVVHHTAQLLKGDTRTPLERVRALYQYHAGSLGWGDIGYNYVIDENGQIYEGRAGGDKVIGGHAYCANVGTVGVALIGNFEQEEPSLDQTRSLQWLIDDLANRYGLDLEHNTVFHGKSMPVVVGHRDTVSTACPGYFLYGVLDQIRRNVVTGNLTASVNFPPSLDKNYADKTDDRRTLRLRALNLQPNDPTLTPIGDTAVSIRPGGQATVSLLFRAGGMAVQRRARIASVMRSSNRIGIWQQLDKDNQRIREEIFAPRLLHEGEVETIRLRFQVPSEPGTYTVDIGPVTFTLNAEGRRTRSPTGEPVSMSFSASDRVNIPTPGSRRNSSASSSPSASSVSSPLIRIRLTSREKLGQTCTSYDFTDLRLRYRGDITCQMIAGKAALIDELLLEDYIAGLGEEPDTEPYEKQRAFAIAARSYAVFYLDAEHRKFPGMPYDGDDSPATFQLYQGKYAERTNPQWVKAVASTTGQVLTKNGGIVKAAYFSSDDGRTRSPAENGWNTFPFAEVFVSKDDPWCKGLPMAGHGVGMSGCGAKAQAQEGKKAEQILEYYYAGTKVEQLAR